MINDIETFGFIDIEIFDRDKNTLTVVKNRILLGGREVLARVLANQISGTFDLFVSSMSFSNGGTVGGVPRFVDDTRTGLFNPALLTKGVISSINFNLPTQAIFTSVITFDELIGQTINEMALNLKDTTVFSMATFGDIAKTSSMQLTFNWRINFV